MYPINLKRAQGATAELRQTVGIGGEVDMTEFLLHETMVRLRLLPALIALVLVLLLDLLCDVFFSFARQFEQLALLDAL